VVRPDGMHLRLLAAAALAAGCPALELPQIDLVGGAAASEGRLGIGLYSTDARARAADRDFGATALIATARSLSAYPSAANPAVGGLLGAQAMLRTWYGHDNGVDWRAADPAAALVGGAYWKATPTLRLAVTGEAGAGLSFARLDDGDTVRTYAFRPSLHAGANIEAMARMSRNAEIGVILGYAHDYLPGVTSAGPFLAFAVTWIAGGKAE